MLGKLVSLENHSDDEGKLVVVEKTKQKFGFEIKRVYYIYDTKDKFIRGKHAHKSLKQLIICVSGACTISLDDGLGKTNVFHLSKPDEGLILESNVWREIYNFSKNCVLVVLASQYYNEDDYIRNYDTFVKYVRDSKEHTS